MELEVSVKSSLSGSNANLEIFGDKLNEIEVCKKTSSPSTNTNLETLRDRIQLLTKQHQVEVLRILHRDPKVFINENKNGVLINLIDLSHVTLNHIKLYLDYIQKQEINLLEIEDRAEKIRTTFF